jgi:hypothetical protein
MKHLSLDLWSSNMFRTREISADVLSAINTSLDQGHCDRLPFQDIKRLTCDSFKVSLQEICMFLSPRLTRLYLTIPDSAVGLKNFFTAVQTTCPFLKVISINGDRNSEELGTAVSSLVYSLSCLEVVWCSNIALNCKALVVLASLPKLWKFHVFLLGGPVLRTFRDDCHPLPFSTLQDFDASVATIGDADEFLQLISSSSSLYSLSVDVVVIPAPRELYSFLTTVHRSSSRDTLTAISLHDMAQVDLDAPLSHSLDAHTISPLLQCPNLQHISFGIRYGQEAINNSLMMDMALAWPRLRTIHFLSFYRGSRWPSKVNLEGLVHLTQGCRALESMSLRFDLSSTMTSIHPHNGIRNESLTYLSVDRSPITDPLAVVTHLFDVFPNLTLYHAWHSASASNLDEGDPEFIEMCKRWAEVDRLLEIRKQERSQVQQC